MLQWLFFGILYCEIQFLKWYRQIVYRSQAFRENVKGNLHDHRGGNPGFNTI